MKVVAETAGGIRRADNYEMDGRRDSGPIGGMLDRAVAEDSDSRAAAGEERAPVYLDAGRRTPSL